MDYRKNPIAEVSYPDSGVIVTPEQARLMPNDIKFFVLIAIAKTSNEYFLSRILV
jgi:hypothetical protein